jgi:hypothetical protein
MGSYKRRVSKEVLAPYTLEQQFGDKQNNDLKVRLHSESLAYPNLANSKFVVEQARAAVQGSIKDTMNVMEYMRNKWLIFYRLWRGESIAQFQYGRQQLHSPEPFKAVETLHPRIMRALFGNERWFKLYGQFEEDDTNAKCQEVLCRHQLREAAYRMKQSRFIREGLMYGTSIQKCFWRQEVGDVMYRTARRVPGDFPGTTKAELSEVKREELLFDGNTVENVSIFDFYTAPNASSIDEAEWAMDRSSWPGWKIKQMGEMGYWTNLEALKDHAGNQDTSHGDEYKERKAYAYGVFDPREASWAAHIPHYTVHDWWGPLAIKKDGDSIEIKECNVVMIDADGLQIIARVTENPFWHRRKPYQKWSPIEVEDEFYGIGTLEMIARLSMEKDMKRNLLMSATQLEGNPAWLIADEANVPDGQLLLHPGLCLRVPDPAKSIMPLPIPQVSDAALKAENILTKDIRETTGSTSPSMGAQDPFGRGKTATQHMAEIDESNIRLAGPIENWELSVGMPMLEQMAWNNQQFMNYERVVRDVGPQGMTFRDRYTIRPEDVLGRFIVQPLAAHRLTTKQIQVQQLTNLLDRAPVINQMYGPNAIKILKLFAHVMETGFDIRNIDEFISVPPEEAGLLTAIQEHELWYHGQVPPRRADDNDARHALVHMEELKTEQFAMLEQSSPGTTQRIRVHIRDHMHAMAARKEQEEKMMADMMQFGVEQGLMQAGGPQNGSSAIPGAAGPEQGPESPKVRRNESERAEGQEANSEANAGAPNLGQA